MRPSRLLRRSRLACFLLAGLASAQQFPFQLNLSQDDSIFAVPNGAALTFSSPVGQPKTARITAIYRGRGQTTITQGPDVFGSAAFTAVFPSSLPLTLNPGESFAVDIQFRPISTAVTTGPATSTARFVVRRRGWATAAGLVRVSRKRLSSVRISAAD